MRTSYDRRVGRCEEEDLKRTHTRTELIYELHRVAALPPSSGRHAREGQRLRQLLRLEDESTLTDPEQDLWDEDRDPNEPVER